MTEEANVVKGENVGNLMILPVNMCPGAKDGE